MAKQEYTPLWGIKIWGDDGVYYFTEVDTSPSLTHFVPTESQDPYNHKYPWVINNGVASYYKGSVTGNFSDNQSTECHADYNFDYHEKNGIVYYNVKYQDAFIQWMHNRKTKYLQLSEQFVISIKVLDSIQWETEHTIDDGWSNKISFDWVQVGDTFSLDETEYIRYCPSCSGIVAPTALFCQKCGTRLTGNG